MKILFLTYDVPWPLDAGGKIRAFHMIKQLAYSHDVTLFTFYRQADQLKDIKLLKDICSDIIAVPRKHKYSPHNALFLPFLPYPAVLYYSPGVTQLILNYLAANKYDLVHFESFYTSPYLSYVTNTPTVLGTENIEWRVYDEYVRRKPVGILKSTLKFEVERIKRYEQQTWNDATLCLAVSPENIAEIKKKTTAPVALVRNGVDLSYFTYSEHSKETRTVLFVGNFSYIQNSDSVKWIVDSILPYVKTPSTFRIVGKNPTAEITALHQTKHGEVTIAVDGAVDDIREAYQDADMMLAPIRVGSGTKFKLIEAMAMGMPIVSNSQGLEGIPVIDSVSALIREDEHELAQAVDILLTSPGRRVELARRAHEIIQQEFSWEAIGKALTASYQSLFVS